MHRRDFITTVGRYAIYGALGVIAAVSLKSARQSSGTVCTEDIPCRECRELTDCNLDPARESRSLAGKELNS